MGRMTFRYMLVTLFIASILLPMIIMGSIVSIYYNNESRSSSEQNIYNSLYTVSENVSIYLDDLRRISISPSVYPDIMKYYTRINGPSEPDSYTDYLLELNYRTLMRRLLTLSRRDIRGVGFIPQSNPDSLIYIHDTMMGTNAQASYDVASMEWYGELMAGGGTPIFIASRSLDYYDETSRLVDAGLRKPSGEEGYFSVIRLVHDESTRAIVGIIKVDASLLVIKDILENLATSENSGMLLLDKKNGVIHSSRPELALLAQEIGPDTSQISTGNDSYRCYIHTIESADWKLVYLDSTRDITTQTRNIVVISVLIASCCTLLGFIIFNIFSRRLTTPVRNIIDTMREVENGNMQARSIISAGANREFTMISEELNNMIRKLDTLINSEYKAVLSQRNAEFLALQTQINPHFLYNTLNGFITLNRLEDKKKLEESILQLTSLFRYTCSNANTATIGEEMHFIEMYLRLQQLRFEDRLAFVIDIDESTQDAEIPRLLIQPLVENAVIHGMEPTDQRFLLEIHAFASTHPLFGPLCVIAVGDNGVGFDERSIAEKNRVGLSNVAERIGLFRGGGILSVHSKEGAGTLCVIALPLDQRLPPPPLQQPREPVTGIHQPNEEVIP